MIKIGTMVCPFLVKFSGGSKFLPTPVQNVLNFMQCFGKFGTRPTGNPGSAPGQKSPGVQNRVSSGHKNIYKKR